MTCIPSQEKKATGATLKRCYLHIREKNGQDSSNTHKKLKTRLVDKPDAQTNDGKDDEVVAFQSEHARSAFMEEDAEAAAVVKEECAIFEFVSAEARRNFLEDWKMRTHGVVLAPDEGKGGRNPN
jgi:hypothetical protein